MSKTIFIVDGSSSIRILYTAFLTEEGYDVQAFEKGADSLAAMKDTRPDLIMMGAELPDGSCIELAKSIRHQPEQLLTPIIVISSSKSVELQNHCFQVGIIDFISKGCTQDYLSQQVTKALNSNKTLSNDDVESADTLKVLIAEDSIALLSLYGQMFEQIGCKPILCQNGEEAWLQLQNDQDVDFILADIEMPIMDGAELNRLIRADERFDNVPIMVVTRFEQKELLCKLLADGANDYITKPFNEQELQARIGSHLRTRQMYKEQQKLTAKLTDVTQQLEHLNLKLEEKVHTRTQELYEANIDTITKLAKVCDYKDNDTGNHINRVRIYSEELGRALGFSDEDARKLGYSSMMHDVGKIVISDDILNKKGPLNPAEWSKMRQHSQAGANLLGNKPFFSMAWDIAMYHHEKVDGSGYPKGLKGDDIPLSAKVVAVVDVFDALVSKRSYKEAWPIQDAIFELQRLSGNHLDKKVVDTFIELHHQGALDYIREQYKDDL